MGISVDLEVRAGNGLDWRALMPIQYPGSYLLSLWGCLAENYWCWPWKCFTDKLHSAWGFVKFCELVFGCAPDCTNSNMSQV